MVEKQKCKICSKTCTKTSSSDFKCGCGHMWHLHESMRGGSKPTADSSIPCKKASCNCKDFKPQKWTPTKCDTCLHLNTEHAAVTTSPLKPSKKGKLPKSSAASSPPAAKPHSGPKKATKQDKEKASKAKKTLPEKQKADKSTDQAKGNGKEAKATPPKLGAKGKSDTWKRDQDKIACERCQTSFTFLNRRHHCRVCGGLFCNACSSEKVAGERACDTCHSLSTGKLDLTEATDVADGIKQGWMMKLSRGGMVISARWQRRYFRLEDGNLLYYNEKPSQEMLAHPKRVLELHGYVAMLLEDAALLKRLRSDGELCLFQLSHATKKAVIYAAENEEDMVDWINAICLEMFREHIRIREAGELGAGAQRMRLMSMAEVAVPDHSAFERDLDFEKQLLERKRRKKVERELQHQDEHGQLTAKVNQLTKQQKNLEKSVSTASGPEKERLEEELENVSLTLEMMQANQLAVSLAHTKELNKLEADLDNGNDSFVGAGSAGSSSSTKTKSKENTPVENNKTNSAKPSKAQRAKAELEARAKSEREEKEREDKERETRKQARKDEDLKRKKRRNAREAKEQQRKQEDQNREKDQADKEAEAERVKREERERTRVERENRATERKRKEQMRKARERAAEKQREEKERQRLEQEEKEEKEREEKEAAEEAARKKRRQAAVKKRIQKKKKEEEEEARKLKEAEAEEEKERLALQQLEDEAARASKELALVARRKRREEEKRELDRKKAEQEENEKRKLAEDKKKEEEERKAREEARRQAQEKRERARAEEKQKREKAAAERQLQQEREEKKRLKLEEEEKQEREAQEKAEKAAEEREQQRRAEREEKRQAERRERAENEKRETEKRELEERREAEKREREETEERVRAEKRETEKRAKEREEQRNAEEREREETKAKERAEKTRKQQQEREQGEARERKAREEEVAKNKKERENKERIERERKEKSKKDLEAKAREREQQERAKKERDQKQSQQQKKLSAKPSTKVAGLPVYEYNWPPGKKYTGMSAVLFWAQQNTQGFPGVKIKNFTKSWQNGLAFGALVANWRPDVIDYYSLDPDTPEATLNRVFAAAEEIGVVALLDAEDIMCYADKKSIYTQLTMYHKALNHLPPHGPPGIGGGAASGRSSPRAAAQQIPPEVSRLIQEMQSLENRFNKLNLCQVQGGEGPKLFEDLKATLPAIKKYKDRYADEIAETVRAYNRLNKDIPEKVNDYLMQMQKKSGGSNNSMCAVCHKALSGQTVEAVGSAFHFECFKCFGCGRKFGQTCINVNNKPYCDACGRKEFTKSKTGG